MALKAYISVAAFFLGVAFVGQWASWDVIAIGRSNVLAPAAAAHRGRKLYSLLQDDESWFYESDTLVSTEFYENTYTKQPYVANGYIGARIPNTGLGYSLDTDNIWSDPTIAGSLNNGWPLRNRRFAGAFVSDFYCLQEKLNSTNFAELDENGYSTVISSIPQWTELQISVQNETKWFDARTVRSEDVRNYNQSLSLNNGIVTTQLDWLDGLIHIKSEVLAHRGVMPLGIVSLTVSLNPAELDDEFEEVDLNVYDVLDFNTSHRTVLQEFGFDAKNEGIYMVVEPENVADSSSAIYSTLDIEEGRGESSQAESFSASEKVSLQHRLTLSKENPRVVIRKYTGIVSTEYNTGNIDIENLDLAKSVATNSKGDYSKLLISHEKAWSELYGGVAIEIPSDKVLEAAAKASMYHLLANTRASNISEKRGLPLGPSGLSADSYGGMVFWDSETWIGPSLLPFWPEIALKMNNYRNSSHAQAVLNARQNGYPGALYPWTAGRYSNCTSTGPCIDYEYHVNIDIALASFSIYLNGANGIDDDYLKFTTWPMIKDAAEFFMSYLKYNETLDKYETLNLTDPNEFANHIDNGAFTNIGIKRLLIWATDIGNHLEEKIDPNWKIVSEKIFVPMAPSNITLEYSGMNSTMESKQADVTLVVYPLDYLEGQSSLDIATKNLYFYSEHQSASGPAMTYPVYVANAAALLNHGSSSQSYLYKSLLPFIRGPFAQFSEQADDNFLTNGYTQPAFPFLTANGGYLQSLVFGLTGIRFSYEVSSDTKKISRVLKFNPIELPLLPEGITIRNFKYMNQVLDIIVDDLEAIIVHKRGNDSIHIEVPTRRSFRDYETEGSTIRRTLHTLHPGEKFIMPLFKSELNIWGNVAENKEIANLTVGVPGDVAYSALDGNNNTHWQPANKKEAAMLLIDLGENSLEEIKGGEILWGHRPAKNFSLYILPHVQGFEELMEEATESEIKSSKAELLKECVLSPDGKCSLKQRFIPVIKNHKVKPSEPFSNQSLIDISPSNITKFAIDYSFLEPSKNSFQRAALRTRYLVVSVQGSYDDDDNVQGATIKEIVLRA